MTRNPTKDEQEQRDSRLKKAALSGGLAAPAVLLIAWAVVSRTETVADWSVEFFGALTDWNATANFAIGFGWMSVAMLLVAGPPYRSGAIRIGALATGVLMIMGALLAMSGRGGGRTALSTVPGLDSGLLIGLFTWAGIGLAVFAAREKLKKQRGEGPDAKERAYRDASSRGRWDEKQMTRLLPYTWWPKKESDEYHDHVTKDWIRPEDKSRRAEFVAAKRSEKATDIEDNQ